ncbi:MAG: hypothetical protein EOP83_25850 [Verrucomicrobiaceae bacterium]|nr:MAG: hypothetical protein EOP83_25850 [Verrucomicrobiaceae bacterium]
MYTLTDDDAFFIAAFPVHVVLITPRDSDRVAAARLFLEDNTDGDYGYRVSEFYCDAHGRPSAPSGPSCNHVRVIFGMKDANVAFELKMRFG